MTYFDLTDNEKALLEDYMHCEMNRFNGYPYKDDEIVRGSLDTYV